METATTLLNSPEAESTSDKPVRRKKCLLVAFDFPPRRTSGIYRPTGLTKYLVQFGWEPTVLTARARKGELQDPTLLERIPPTVRTVRTRYLDFTRWEEPTARVARGTGTLRSQANRSQRPGLDRVLRRLGAFARSCLYFPDDTVGWIPFGLAKAIWLKQKDSFDLVYSSSPPRSSLIISLLLKMLLRVCWVAEFRDPWFLAERPIRRRIERWLIGLILRKADAIVVVTANHARELSDSYGIPGQKIVVIPNGFDEEDFPSDHNVASSDLLAPGYIHLTHFGTVYPNCSGAFFQALEEIVTDCPEMKERIRVNIIGYPDEVVRRHAADKTLADIVHVYGFMPHRQAIRAMYSSDCLLLFYANSDFSRLAVAGKTYEYLRVGRPILAITREGGMKRLIEEGKAGWVAHPEDAQAIKRALLTVLQDGRSSRPNDPAREEFVAQFRYDRLAGRLAGVFDEVSKCAGQPSPRRSPSDR
jgi:glycosyltransferase involved in cell wall biosynthesis